MLKKMNFLLVMVGFAYSLNALAADTMTYDDVNACGPNRRILEKSLLKVPDLFRLPRAGESGALPKSCVNYILRHGGFTYAKCTAEVSKPVYFGMGDDFKPCVTSNYFNSIYNTYVDIMDCLDLDPKELLPRLYVESALHINSFNRTGYDSGVGQLTDPAIADVLLDGFDIRVGRVTGSQKESCKRVASIPGIFKKVGTSRATRCELIEPGANPARNILYTGFYDLVTHKRVKIHMTNEKIAEKMVQAGLTNYDEAKLLNLVSTLAYNVGPGSAVNYLETYLDARIAKIKLKKGNSVKESDFDFSLNPESDFALFNDIHKNYAKNKAYGDNLLATTGIQNTNFSRFMIFVQDVGSRGYLTHLSRMKKELDEKMEKNVCTSDSYLKL